MDHSSYRISEKTVARVASAAILSVPGTRAVDAKLAGLAGRSFPRVDARIDRPASSVALDIEIVTDYPAPVGAITDEVRQTVGTHVEMLTGLAVSRVNIAVADAELPSTGGRITRDDLARHPVGLTPTPLRISRSRVTSPVTKPAKELTSITVDSSTYDKIRHVDVPAPPKVASIHAPKPVRPASVVTPPPVEPRRVAVPEQVGLRPVDVEKQKALRPVSLPYRRRLDPVHAHRPTYVPVERPMPQPLRQITVTPSQVTAPQMPAPKPLSEVRIDPDRVDEDSYTETAASRKDKR
ncbi:Asp23/Gls24 family envelope stress response protein [Corynebacterium meitnerae]|uniref:Asp23/Gls24 family envelope stress response protein n=1 Tax=Corynebacterium meitnerae TaxID=2913498 RepID=A0A9X3RKF2_9CORY|nr:Asp23/Gls24 family envelope stress response protein [Corynebacterium meitnerae]MCZ9293827.1 Asp23/Gls24 family envelope stress response protein [Corynebacterium meitnerae]